MGGSDDPSNIIELTTEEHALAHKKLYEEHGKIQDYVAWKALSGCIGKEEIHKLLTIKRGKANGMYGKGYKIAGDKNGMWNKKHTPESLEKMRQKLRYGENNANFGGVLQTLEVREKMSDLKKGSKNNQWNKHWYTNGTENVFCFEEERPEGFRSGRVNGTKKGFKTIAV